MSNTSRRLQDGWCGRSVLCFLLGLMMGSGAARAADDELPAVEFSSRPVETKPGRARALNPHKADLGLIIEGEVSDQRRLGQLILGGQSGDRVLYEDEYHQIIGNPARPSLRMMYRHDPDSTDWRYDGSVVRGHVARGSQFGYSVAVIKPYLAVMDWSARPSVAAIVIYEKTPNSVRGWKKRFEVVADDIAQAQCMGGVEAEKWLARWLDNRGADCGVRTLDGTAATTHAIQNSRLR